LAKLQLFDENEELANLVNEEKVNRAMQQMPLF